MKRLLIYVFLIMLAFTLVFSSSNAQEIEGIRLGSTTEIDTVIEYVSNKPYQFSTINENDGRCITVFGTPCKSKTSYLGREISYIEFRLLKKKLEKNLGINFQQIKNARKDKQYFYRDSTTTYILQQQTFEGVNYVTTSFAISLVDKDPDKVDYGETIIVNLP